MRWHINLAPRFTAFSRLLALSCLGVALTASNLVSASSSASNTQSSTNASNGSVIKPDAIKHSIRSNQSTRNNRNAQQKDAELKAFLQQNIGSDQAIQDKFDAEVWLVGMRSRMSAYKIDRQIANQILTTVYQEAHNSGLAPDIVLALIAVESSFNRYAISRVGAQGLMQIMPFWKNEIGRPEDNLTDIATNIRYGCKILQFYLQKENGDLALALARYNGSVGRTVYSEKVLVLWEQHWRSGRM